MANIATLSIGCKIEDADKGFKKITAQAEKSVHAIQKKVLNLGYENLGSILDVPSPRFGGTV